MKQILELTTSINDVNKWGPKVYPKTHGARMEIIKNSTDKKPKAFYGICDDFEYITVVNIWK